MDARNHIHFTSSIFTIPVDDNYNRIKKNNQYTCNANILRTHDIFINNHPHIIHSYLKYYEKYYVNKMQMNMTANTNSFNGVIPQRRYTYTPSISNSIFK